MFRVVVLDDRRLCHCAPLQYSLDCRRVGFVQRARASVVTVSLNGRTIVQPF